jgi:hypothetical protein
MTEWNIENLLSDGTGVVLTCMNRASIMCTHAYSAVSL